MIQYRLRRVFVLTTIVAVGLVCYRNPSEAMALCLNVVLIATALLALGWRLYNQPRRIEPRCFVAALTLTAICFSGYEIPTPPQLYVCGPPFGHRPFWTTPGLWKITNAVLATGLACGVLLLPDRLWRRKMQSAYEYTAMGFVITVISLLVVKLVDSRLYVAATLSQYAANLFFIASTTWAIYSSSSTRLFWATTALVRWVYLYLETLAIWPCRAPSSAAPQVSD